MVHPEREVAEAQQVFLVLLEDQVHQGHRVNEVAMVLLEKLVLLGSQEMQEHQDHKDREDPEEKEVHQAHLEHQVHLVSKEIGDHLDQGVNQELQELLATLVC